MAENIFLFYPNIIGYVRIAFTFLSCYYWFTHPLTSAFFFVMSQTFLDDLDGIAARRFNQATLFGGTLDIVIDRCSFMVYLMGLCVLYPNYMILFQFVGFLDISRMWMKMYSAAVTGNYFKKVDNAILKFYYSEVMLYSYCYCSS
jgi:CDP-diacylglycerol--inositol 3-phosphatidyltransferase